MMYCLGLHSHTLYPYKTSNFNHLGLDKKLENASDCAIQELISTHAYVNQLCLVDKLFFSAHSQLTNQGLASIARAYPGLQGFSIINATNVTDEGMQAIVTSCKNLKVFCLNKCSKVTDKVVNILADNNEQLEILKINREGGGLEFELCDSTFNSSSSETQQGMGLSERSVWFPALTHLELTNCRVTNQDLEAINKLCPKLQSLKLHACHALQESDLLLLLEKFTALELLILNKNRNIKSLTLDYTKFPNLMYSDINGLKITSNKRL